MLSFFTHFAQTVSILFAKKWLGSYWGFENTTNDYTGIVITMEPKWVRQVSCCRGS